VPRGALRSPP